jgi:hypothetical protein
MSVNFADLRTSLAGVVFRLFLLPVVVARWSKDLFAIFILCFFVLLWMIDRQKSEVFLPWTLFVVRYPIPDLSSVVLPYLLVASYITLLHGGRLSCVISSSVL